MFDSQSLEAYLASPYSVLPGKLRIDLLIFAQLFEQGSEFDRSFVMSDQNFLSRLNSSIIKVQNEWLETEEAIYNNLKVTQFAKSRKELISKALLERRNDLIRAIDNFKRNCKHDRMRLWYFVSAFELELELYSKIMLAADMNMEFVPDAVRFLKLYFNFLDRDKDLLQTVYVKAEKIQSEWNSLKTTCELFSNGATDDED